jgi:3-dehydroquinate synthase
MQTLNVDLADRSYPIFIGSGLLDNNELIQSYLGKGKVVVVSNNVVEPLYLDRIRRLFGNDYDSTVVIKDGEEHKTLRSVNQIYDHLITGKHDRNTTLVALGGGVVGDITGFAAATYQRGIKFIQIPTTLLAQVDSSVGGKTGVNHELGKNMIGAFYQPQCVIADTNVLRTLPEREIRAGLAEVIKYGVINNAEFFTWLEKNSQNIISLDSKYIAKAVGICCKAKADIVTEDEKETGSRALLNLGHTFGHAIETAVGYGKLLHGETVAMGIVMAADLSKRLGWLAPIDAIKIRRVLEENYGLPVEPPAGITVEQYLDLMLSDKKAEFGKIRFVLLKAIGRAVIEGDIDSELLKSTLKARSQLCM